MRSATKTPSSSVREESKQFGKVSLTLGIIALLAILGLPVITFVTNLQIGFAVPEFAESLVLSLWTFWTSLKLLRNQTNRKPTFEKHVVNS